MFSNESGNNEATGKRVSVPKRANFYSIIRKNPSAARFQKWLVMKPDRRPDSHTKQATCSLLSEVFCVETGNKKATGKWCVVYDAKRCVLN